MPQINAYIDWDNSGTYDLTQGADVTARVLADRGVTMERGRDQLRALAPPMAGKLDFALDNRSRDYSAKNVTSPRYAQLRPGHRVRVTATNGGTTYPLATALLDDLPQEPAFGARSVGVPCLGLLSRLAGKSVTTAVYQDITTDVAIGYLLDAAGWPASERFINLGQTLLRWWWLDDADAFGALRTLLNTEGPGAALYERADGKLAFEGRHFRVLDGRANTSQGTFRDSGAGPWHREPFALQPNLKNVINRAEIPINMRTPLALAEVWALGANLVLAPLASVPLIIRATTGDPFQGAVTPVLGTDYTLIAGTVGMALDRTSGRAATLTVTAGAAGATLTALRLRAQRLAATTVRATNTLDTSASRARYGVQTWADSVWPEIDLDQAEGLCNAIVGAYREPRASARITIEGADAAMLAHCLTREISDRVTVVEAQTGLNGDLYIEHIRHEIGVVGRIVTTLGLEEVVPGTQSGIWDYTAWDQATWGY